MSCLCPTYHRIFPLGGGAPLCFTYTWPLEGTPLAYHLAWNSYLQPRFAPGPLLDFPVPDPLVPTGIMDADFYARLGQTLRLREVEMGGMEGEALSPYGLAAPSASLLVDSRQRPESTIDALARYLYTDSMLIAARGQGLGGCGSPAEWCHTWRFIPYTSYWTPIKAQLGLTTGLGVLSMDLAIRLSVMAVQYSAWTEAGPPIGGVTLEVVERDLRRWQAPEEEVLGVAAYVLPTEMPDIGDFEGYAPPWLSGYDDTLGCVLPSLNTQYDAIGNRNYVRKDWSEAPAWTDPPRDAGTFRRPYILLTKRVKWRATWQVGQMCDRPFPYTAVAELLEGWAADAALPFTYTAAFTHGYSGTCEREHEYYCEVELTLTGWQPTPIPTYYYSTGTQVVDGVSITAVAAGDPWNTALKRRRLVRVELDLGDVVWCQAAAVDGDYPKHVIEYPGCHRLCWKACDE